MRDIMQNRIYAVDMPLFAEPPRARRSDPQTSKDAAAALSPGSSLEALAVVYKAAGMFGMTDEEAGDAVAIPGAWKRCSDLRRLGLIADTGLVRKARSGRAQRVCRWIGAKA
jgi:hypothetical protein